MMFDVFAEERGWSVVLMTVICLTCVVRSPAPSVDRFVTSTRRKCHFSLAGPQFVYNLAVLEGTLAIIAVLYECEDVE